MATSPENRLRLALQRSVACFRNAHISYALIGAFALAVWGRVRATHDLDFLILVDETNLESLGNKMVEAGMEIDQAWQDWNPMLRGTVLRLQCEDVPVDLLRPRDTHDLETFRRRRKKLMERRYYWFVSPEDCILQKLKAGRLRDFEDVATIIERSRADLDHKYLHRWAGRLGVSGELGYILNL